MAARRSLIRVVFTVLAVLGTAVAQVPATAQTSATKVLRAPWSYWEYPTLPPDSLDAVGSWMYIAPQAAPRPGQVSAKGYEFLVEGAIPGIRFAGVGIGTRDDGTPVARLVLTDMVLEQPSKVAAEVPYNWSPGRFYFVFAKRLPSGDIAGWVMDWATAVWSYIGSVRPPASWEPIMYGSRTIVRWNSSARPTECGGYPLTDVYMFPGLGYKGETWAIGELYNHADDPGDCPAQAQTLENGWVHYRLGA